MAQNSATQGDTTGGLAVDAALAAFVAEELLPRLDLSPEWFWSTLADLHRRFAPRVTELLARRDELQGRLDAWHREHGAPGDGELDGYVAFLEEIGYLLPQEDPRIAASGVDREIAEVPGPQLVVPATVPRYALNAVNARWGSLFDALYGTDALPSDHDLAPGYDERRGAQVIAEADRLLDEYVPLAGASHTDVTAYRVESPDGGHGALAAETGSGVVGLADAAQFAGYRGDPAAPEAVLLRRHGLHLEIGVDGGSRVGRQHHAQVSDVLLESAVTTIVDLEDSVATVDGPDKVGAYRSWLGLMTGELEATFPKGGKDVTRTVNGDRTYTAPDGGAGEGGELVLPGRSLLLVRNVGHHMRLDAVRAPSPGSGDGEPLLEECLDILVSTVAALYDLRGMGRYSNSRAGSLYVVKPKMHGPDEVALSVDLFAAVEQALELSPGTIKIGIMDEERRTSVNLEACIARAAERVIFVNTGFLDRTGDEIHTVFEAGPVIRKDDEKSSVWLQAYENRNVDVALRAGFAGQAQVGKGMWAQPAGMRAMLDTKGAQPKAGANTAWVPSPTAATLHALHYLETDVHAVQRELAARPLTDRRRLLVAPVLPERGAELSGEQKRHELETNAQSILGYVVRWVGLGIGCSTVPDLDGVGLMEDRATLRISSQEIANWLHHGLVDEAEVRETFARMAALVDEQNAREPGYAPMSKDLEHSPSFQAALELVLAGRQEPNGYTERALTLWRQRAKAGQGATDTAAGGDAGTRSNVLDDGAPSPAG